MIEAVYRAPKPVDFDGFEEPARISSSEFNPIGFDGIRVACIGMKNLPLSKKAAPVAQRPPSDREFPVRMNESHGPHTMSTPEISRGDAEAAEVLKRIGKLLK